MLWKGGRESGNVIDLRGMGGRGLAIGGGGCGTLIILILALIFGFDPSQFLDTGSRPLPDQTAPSAQQQSQAPDEGRQFVSAVLASTEDFWRTTLPQQARRQYRDPQLVLFSGRVDSACGYASSATGPFYCPGDSRVYVDLDFFRELRTKFRAPGDFAQAYVLAHEVGHHVQNLLGTTDKVDAYRGRVREEQYNQLSVALELQADCYAGVWGNYAQKRGMLEAGDVEEGLKAAAAVGDDTIQRRTQGYVVPESFTHGSSQQRAQWFMRGFQSGDIRQCDTFNTGGRTGSRGGSF
jgi:uncharacterized protein